ASAVSGDSLVLQAGHNVGGSALISDDEAAAVVVICLGRQTGGVHTGNLLRAKVSDPLHDPVTGDNASFRAVLIGAGIQAAGCEAGRCQRSSNLYGLCATQ